MSQHGDEIRRLLGTTFVNAQRIAQRVAQRGTTESNEEAAFIGVLVLQLANARNQNEYLAERLDVYINEAQRLALLAYNLGGDPVPPSSTPNDEAGFMPASHQSTPNDE